MNMATGKTLNLIEKILSLKTTNRDVWDKSKFNSIGMQCRVFEKIDEFLDNLLIQIMNEEEEKKDE